MPLTPTHILAILPIAAVKHLSLPFSALVIGSMIPDFPLFVPLSPDYGTTHSVPGLLTACLPLGLGCFLVFQLLMKRPLFALPTRRRSSVAVRLLHACVEPNPKSFACAYSGRRWPGPALIFSGIRLRTEDGGERDSSRGSTKPL